MLRKWKIRLLSLAREALISVREWFRWKGELELNLNEDEFRQIRAREFSSFDEARAMAMRLEGRLW